MSDIDELYQEIILDHNKRPRNFHALEHARKAEGDNPMCGDHVTVYVKVSGGKIENVAFQGSGCAISTASASIMTELLKGKTQEEADALFHRFQDLVTGKSAPSNQSSDALEAFDTLEAFEHVSAYPMRIKCATLAWHTLKAAIEGRETA